MKPKISLPLGLAFALVSAPLIAAPAWAGDATPNAGPAKSMTPPAPIPGAKAKPAPSPAAKAATPPAANADESDALDPKLGLQMANDYFNHINTMIADFVQIGGDGRRAEGKIFVQKPGKLRFEYAEPATLDIVADGTTVAIIDRKAGSMQQYFIWQTPLKFLLKPNIDLAKDTTVTKVESEPDTLTIYLEDKQVFGGPTKIKLMFDPKPFRLRQWLVTDPQGYETLVSLFNQDFKTKPDPSYFQLYQSSAK
jgi:outer membrane lipoprotein-sorting protein